MLKRQGVKLMIQSELFWLNPFDDSETEPILRDVFTGWTTGEGIFDALEDNGNLPWSSDTSIDNSVLDVAYFGNHSGGKFCSPLVKLLIDDGEVTAAGRVVIAKIILSKYLKNWDRLWETNVVAYSPVHNYDMTEERTRKLANSEAEVANENQAHTGTDTITHGKVETIEHGREFESTDYIYGLNTEDDPKPSEKTSSGEDGETVTTNSGSDVNTKNLADTKSNNRNLAGAEEEEEEIHRAGNIGVTTTQKLVEEERQLWRWNFFEQVFNDLDNELALAFHDSCRV